MTCGYYWNPRRSNALEPCQKAAVGVGGVMDAPECQEHRNAREDAAMYQILCGQKQSTGLCDKPMAFPTTLGPRCAEHMWAEHVDTCRCNICVKAAGIVAIYEAVAILKGGA